MRMKLEKMSHDEIEKLIEEYQTEMHENNKAAEVLPLLKQGLELVKNNKITEDGGSIASQ